VHSLDMLKFFFILVSSQKLPIISPIVHRAAAAVGVGGGIGVPAGGGGSGAVGGGSGIGNRTTAIEQLVCKHVTASFC
jgi:hypothetical protein